MTTDTQLAESKLMLPEPDEVRNGISARLSFGGVFLSTPARPAFSWPTPAAPALACGTGLAVTISTPLTMSGVQSGCRADRTFEPMSLTPTVITNGSLPGACRTPLGLEALP